MKKYRTSYGEIEEIDVLRETEKCVIIQTGDGIFYKNGERRDMKRTEHSYNYFDTWQEARQFLIDRENTVIADLEKQIAAHRATLQKIEAMKQ